MEPDLNSLLLRVGEAAVERPERLEVFAEYSRARIADPLLVSCFADYALALEATCARLCERLQDETRVRTNPCAECEGEGRSLSVNSKDGKPYEYLVACPECDGFGTSHKAGKRGEGATTDAKGGPLSKEFLARVDDHAKSRAEFVERESRRIRDSERITGADLNIRMTE